MKRSLFATSAMLALVFGFAAAPTSWAKPSDLPSNNQIECPDGSDDPVQPPRFSIEVNLDLLSKRVTVKVDAAATQPEAPTNIDAFSPAVVSAYFNVRVEQVPLQQAIKNLAHVTGLPIVVDYKAMREARINLDAPVTLKVENTSAHKALCQFLDEIGLTYEIENGFVKITTKPCGNGTPAERDAAAKDAQAQRIFEIAERFRRAGDYSEARACYQQVHRLTPVSLHGRVAITRLIEIEERMTDAAEEQGSPGRADDTDDPEQAFRDMRDRTVPLGLVDVSF